MSNTAQVQAFQRSRKYGSQLNLLKRLGPSRQRLMQPVFEHPRHYVLLSARGMARELKKDSATVVRTVRAMGFNNYKEFQHYLQELSVASTTPLDLMKGVSGFDSDLPAYAKESLERDSTNLQSLRQNLDFKRVLAVVKRLYAARRILILAGDQAITLAKFIEYTLTMIGLPVFSAVTPGRVVHAVRNVGSADVVVGLTFGRGLRQTVTGFKQARSNDAFCVGISDTLLSPLARYAHELFVTSIESPSFAGSYVAPMALLNVILVTCAHYRRARTINQLKQAEEEQRTGFRWYVGE
jgi:RpiR family transcriptional regulator, carbohydrate utilization regulator